MPTPLMYFKYVIQKLQLFAQKIFIWNNDLSFSLCLVDSLFLKTLCERWHLNISTSYKMSCQRLICSDFCSDCHLPLVCCSLLCLTHWMLSSVTFSAVLRFYQILALALLFSLPRCPNSEVLTNKETCLSDGQTGPLPYNTQDVRQLTLCISLQYRFERGKIQMLKCAFCGRLNENFKNHFPERLHIN